MGGMGVGGGVNGVGGLGGCGWGDGGGEVGCYRGLRSCVWSFVLVGCHCDGGCCVGLRGLRGNGGEMC